MASSETLSSSMPRGEPKVVRDGDPPAHLREALWLLLQAHDYAEELRQDRWDLAVELSVLRAVGLTNSDLRWLIGRSLVEHAVEVTGPEDAARAFRRTPLVRLTESTCLVLTSLGVCAAREAQCTNGAASPLHLPTVSPLHMSAATPLRQPLAVAPRTVLTGLTPDDLPRRPKWDQQRRQLRVGAQVVKEFKLPSPNQETVLTAFEEEAWPPRIDDPLSPLPNLDPRRRLHDTIKALNRKPKHDLVRFRGDGSGEGIRWEFIVS